MQTNSPNIEIKSELLSLIKELCSSYKEILLFSLATTDGFNVKSFASKSLNVEADKLAAMSSSLFALSDSASSQLMKDKSTITTIESDNGHYFLMKTNYLSHTCVISMVVKSSMSLAEARFHLKKVADSIASIT